MGKTYNLTNVEYDLSTLRSLGANGSDAGLIAACVQFAVTFGRTAVFNERYAENDLMLSMAYRNMNDFFKELVLK